MMESKAAKKLISLLTEEGGDVKPIVVKFVVYAGTFLGLKCILSRRI
jgi:hypothetical protein